MNYTDVNYKSIPEDNECVINAVQLGKRIEEPPSTIRTWAETYQDHLYIKKVNGRFVYTEASVEQFLFIKDMCRNKRLQHKQILALVDKHGFKYGAFDAGLVNPEDPLGYQALASALSVETQKQLSIFLNSFMQYQHENNTRIIENIKNEVSITVDEVVTERLNEFKDDYIKQQEEEKMATIKTMEMVSELNSRMEERKKEEEKRFWKRLFK